MANTQSNKPVWDCLKPISGRLSLQMSIDVELLTYCEDHPRSAFLRFYRMDPPGVTIGRHQRWRRVLDPQVCADRNWDWARRPTGGGALLHANEINFAVIIGAEVWSTESDRGRRFREVFLRIMKAMAGTMESIGVHAVVHSGRVKAVPGSVLPQHGLCGRSLTQYELSFDGSKLLAAAQLLGKGAVLQHGTIYLRAPDLVDRFWPLSDDESLALDQRWCSLPTDGSLQPWESIAASLQMGFLESIRAYARAWTPDPAAWHRIHDRVQAWNANGWRVRR